MSSLTAYVTGSGAGLLWKAMTWMGLGSGTKNAALSFFYSLMSSNIGDYIAIPLAIIIWTYDQIGNIDVSLPNWVTWLYNYVTGQIQPNWTWVLNNVSTLLTVAHHLGDTIRSVASALISDAFAGWKDVLQFGAWLLSRGHDVLVAFIGDPFGFIGKLIAPVLSALIAPFLPILQLFTQLLHPLANVFAAILRDPIGWVWNAFVAALQLAPPPFNILGAALAWLSSNGLHNLVTFFQDPGKVILDLIADLFVPWFLDLVNKVW